MNLGIFSGVVCSIPKTSIMQLKSGFVGVCKFVIAICEGGSDYSEDCCCEMRNVDFFECFAVGETAKMISKKFSKWSKIVIKGKVKNFVFQDINNTKHFTNFIFVEQVEFEDAESMLSKEMENICLNDKQIIVDLRELDRLYKEICDNNYLCIDEEDYYNIATLSVH